jgi:ATP-dependent DNA helicase DinG
VNREHAAPGIQHVAPAPSTKHGAPSTDLRERVVAVFADDGPLARAIEGFEPRPGQRQLADAVARVFAAGGTLVAEAGTGTGKTLAYLVPAVLDGKRVLISTGTRTLQDQIFYKDVPALERALALNVRAAYMKGRTNYLCLHRFERLQEAEAGLKDDERVWLQRIALWASATDTGDRSEIEDLPDYLPLWSEVTATSDQCVGRECHRFADCFVTRMRDRAADAKVVIVNHHLLCADAAVRESAYGTVIPECELAIIDEAHQLEDVATQYFGVSLSAHRIEDLVRDATHAISVVPAEQGRIATSLQIAAGDIEHAAKRVFDAARIELHQDRVTLTPDSAIRLSVPGTGLEDALGRFAALARTLTGEIEDLKSVCLRIGQLRDDLKVLLSADDPAFVHFIEGRGRGVLLRASPIDVSTIVSDSVLAGRDATVLTSATLTVESSFDYLTGRLGVGDASTLALPSEFDFRRQALLYLPPEMPDPREPDYNRAVAWQVAELLDRTEGRAFVLFTSYAAMHDVHERLSRRVSWPLLVQGAAPRTVLLRDFRATPNAVLLATSSFWQGVDVAGEALSAVIIDRLPFASPADPLISARMAAIQARGGRPFDDYQVPLATLTLLQGLGRLIRTRSDRGLLAVLDPRLRQKAYGRRFLASLPPAPITDDLGVVGEFFRKT